MAQSNNNKAPPILTDDVDYEKWKKELKFEEKQAPAFFFTFNRTSP